MRRADIPGLGTESSPTCLSPPQAGGSQPSPLAGSACREGSWAGGPGSAPGTPCRRCVHMASSLAQRTSCKRACVTELNGKEHGDVQEEGQRAGSSKSNLGSLMQARMELQAQLPATPSPIPASHGSPLSASRRLEKIPQ